MAEEAVRDMGDVPRLTKTQARLLGLTTATGYVVMDGAGEHGAVRAMVRAGLGRISMDRFVVNDLGRAALSKHREAANG
ncbi:hypothetical protein D9623_33500 (plasmid) [Azospirillum brasilense]|uniref:Uncharacterized protein n=1 Tax=Azospirillum brasilense TaxID=192 RepID=A0A4D8QTG4_AZOBR|nr:MULTISPECIES: hypothetical protein [Azospirillum]MDW7555355.1 hypothetical protein [Azospirillum brasilense]MDW7595237.1 hypothetical protein [Azospirillum brasilense]MDW7630391.1 hypothetical protein [Azospirillum brasilense]MDX5949758.1 hypothetical protein [Azospirillum brasilense]QCO12821.1 hypothetical protein D3868_27830 [Azospirillum brasilense]